MRWQEKHEGEKYFGFHVNFGGNGEGEGSMGNQGAFKKKRIKLKKLLNEEKRVKKTEKGWEPKNEFKVFPSL